MIHTAACIILHTLSAEAGKRHLATNNRAQISRSPDKTLPGDIFDMRVYFNKFYTRAHIAAEWCKCV